MLTPSCRFVFGTLIVAFVGLNTGAVTQAPAQNVSERAILQWFEASWETMETRTADLFTAGYGAVWTPSPGRGIYTTGGNGIGYDIYDRFDLGQAGDPTLYGTEQGYRSAISSIQRSGGKVFADFIINHASSFDHTDVDSNGVRFERDPSNSSALHGGGNPGFAQTFAGDSDGDFHPNPPITSPSDPTWEYQFQLADLYDIDHRKSGATHDLIRQPVTSGDPRNIPNAATATYQLPEFDPSTHTFRNNPTARMANVPTAKNRRFYPDQTQSDLVNDHVPGNPSASDGTQTLYNFSGSEASAGVPVAENANAIVMRHARWMVQDVGVDGFRVDAARHVYPFVFDYYDRAVWLSDKRPYLDGSQRHVYSFLEAFVGDKTTLDSWANKDLGGAPNSTVQSNRDVLDMPLFFALRDNLTGNTSDNNWFNIRNASIDIHADNQFHDGSDGVMFVASHDEEGAHLSNVAHAYILMHPGRALVYHNAREFNANPLVDERPFPHDGRGDALGGLYGDTLTTLVNIQNTHGRGDYYERHIDNHQMVYEREGSAVIAMNSRNGGFGDWDAVDNVQTAFAPGEILVELTGNALNPTIDSNEGNQFEIPEVLIVDANGQVDLRVPQNHPDGSAEHGKGYVIYGLATPQTTLTISNVAGALGGETPTAQSNPTNVLTTIDVITADSFEVRLDTAAVTHTDGGNSYRDKNADGDGALIKLDDGVSINNMNFSGSVSGVDFVNPSDPVTYGFEIFSTENKPGFFETSGDGVFRQTIDATELSEGEHYITTRAFRRRSDGGVPVYTDDRRVVYIDRLAPDSGLVSFDKKNRFIQDQSLTGVFPVSGGATRDVVIQSLDLTAETVHVFVNEGAATSDASLLARAQAGEGLSDQIDRDVFKLTATGVGSGNHAFTVLTYERTGTYNIQRFSGQAVTDGLGLGIGDLDHSGSYSPLDLSGSSNAFEAVLYSQNADFSPAADVNADGLVDTADLLGLGNVLQASGANSGTLQAYCDVLRRRADVDQSGVTDGADVDFLVSNYGSSDWYTDLNGDGVTNAEDSDMLLSQLLGTAPGDANLDGNVDHADFAIWNSNRFQGDTDWGTADFNFDGLTDVSDFDIWLSNLGHMGGGCSGVLAANVVPEPASAVLLLMGLLLMVGNRRSRSSICYRTPQQH